MSGSCVGKGFPIYLAVPVRRSAIPCRQAGLARDFIGKGLPTYFGRYAKPEHAL